MSELVPYQPEDYFYDGSRKMYRGPIWKVTYPQSAHLLADNEVRSWPILGYQVRSTIQQADVQARSEFSVTVLGDIPEWFENNLKREIGATCTLVKPRGQAISL